MRRICCVIVEPDCSFHSHTCATNVLAPEVVARRALRPASWRSTTICVAMPAWSVPGSHSVL